MLHEMLSDGTYTGFGAFVRDLISNLLQPELQGSINWIKWRRQLISTGGNNNEQLYQTLDTWRQYGNTFLYYVCDKNDVELLEWVVHRIDRQQMYQLLIKPYNVIGDKSVLFLLRDRHLDGILKTDDTNLLSLLSKEQKFDILLLKCDKGQTILHLAAQRGSPSLIKWFLRQLEIEHQRNLMAIRETEGGKTAMDIATDCGATECFDVLRDFHMDAEISVVLEMENKEDQRLVLGDLIQHQPLSRDHIKKLTPISESFIIPRNSVKVKSHALIFYNTDNREGAYKEADRMDHALKASVSSVNMVEWKSSAHLLSLMDDKLDDVVSGSSLLIVSIMAHGRLGSLVGSDESSLPISDVLKFLTDRLPEEIPLVLIIQCCQGYATGNIQIFDMAQQVSSTDDKHIVLTRRNTVLLLATVTGGKATRGAYTGALSDQFLKADGVIDFYGMHLNAVNCMEKENGDEQVPEYRDTLGKRLILPKPLV